MGNTLAEYKLGFEDIPEKQYNKITKTRKGGKDNKMSKQEVTAKPVKKYTKTRGEHIKDLLIVALVVGMIGFGLGYKFQSDRNAELQKAVSTATAQAEAVETPVKK